MNRNKSLFCLIGLTLALVSCRGRIDDRQTDDRAPLDAESLGLTAQRPTLVSFAAGWCKPCRKEITYLNKIYDQYQDQLNVVGFLVEGQNKGQRPNAAARTAFKDKDSLPASYPIVLDPDWQIFERFAPRMGRQLPFIIFLDRQGRIQQRVQKSMDLTDELYPMVQALIAEQNVELPAHPDPESEESEETSDSQTVRRRTLSISEMLNASTPEQAGPIRSALEQAFAYGCEKEGFATKDYVFEDGLLSVLEQADKTLLISKATWKSQTGCELYIWFRDNLSIRRTSALCI